MENITFVILRHISNPHQNYWIDCYNSIRKFYNNQIIIIDDNSNQEYITQYPTTNCQIIQSEFPGAGEILPYYYFHKFKWSEKMIFLHDSMILLNKFNENKINNITDVSFLWYFSDHCWDSPSILDKIKLLNNKKLIQTYHKKKLWWGCFGVSSIITWDFLNILQQEFNLFNLVKHIKNRNDRMDLERIFAICCFTILEKNNYFFRCIHDMPNCWNIFNSDFKNKNNKIKYWKNRCNVLKFWSGR